MALQSCLTNLDRLETLGIQYNEEVIKKQVP